MIPVYVPVSDRRRITIPLVVFQQLDMGTSKWLRLSIVEPGRALLERVPPDPRVARVSDLARCGRIPNAGARLVPFTEPAAVMIQVYVPVRPGKRITLPTVACRGMQVKDGDWLRLTTYEDGRSVLERMPVQSPEPIGSVPDFPCQADPRTTAG